MTKIRFKVELEYDGNLMHGDDPESIKWFFDEVLHGDLILHSNDIGDGIGAIRILDGDINGLPWDAPWNVVCIRYRGRVLRGRLAHYCGDWDGLPIEEGDPEMESCTCLFDAQAFGNWSA